MTWIYAVVLAACLCGMVASLAPWVTVVLMAAALLLLLSTAIGTSQCWEAPLHRRDCGARP